MSETAIVEAQCLTSLASVFLAFMVGQASRYFIRKNWTNIDDTSRVILHELVATFEKAVTCLELPIILDDAGLFWYLLLLTLTGMWFSTQWDRTKSSIPNHIENLTFGRIAFTNVLIQMSIELGWGMLIYPLYVRPLWSLFPGQPIRAMKFNGVWISDLKANNITWYQGCWVEFIGSFLLQLLALLVAGMLSNEWISEVLMQCLSSAVVGYTLDTAGGYFNPVIATILLAGTEGISTFELIMVYWVGSVSGTIVAYLLFKGILTVIGDDDRKQL
ncbi:unnamed protein product [Allacma fusca]|uniref:Aquaporin n=1 Tax=Allacma fusca TaxID=39272 RepID=A0A8J2J3Q4_9HEXA|nr:unnamed protein product [Allacma fusca]